MTIFFSRGILYVQKLAIILEVGAFPSVYIPRKCARARSSPELIFERSIDVMNKVYIPCS